MVAGAITLASRGVTPERVGLRSHYRDSGFFVARTPLLPWCTLTDWNAGAAASIGSWSKEVYDGRRATLVDRLRQLFARQDVAEAMFFTSSRLAQNVAAWVEGEPRAGLELTLTRYLARMAGRETPFGVFAGISCGRVARETCLELAASEKYRRHTRPSMSHLDLVLREAAAREDVRGASAFVPSSTLYRCFGRYRFTRVDAGDASAPLLDVEASPELDRALAKAQSGATLDELACAIAAHGTPAAEAAELAHELIEQGLLVPSWLPPVTGQEPCAALAESARAVPPLQALAAGLASSLRGLAEADRAPLGRELGRLKALASELEAGATPALRPHVLQADLVKPAPALSLSGNVVRTCLRAAELIQRTGSPVPDPRLEEFRRRFVARYESRLVPLVEALDQDLGIGFDHLQQRHDDALVHELGLRRVTTPVSNVENTDVRLRILSRALRRGGTSYELDAGTLAEFPDRRPGELPESFAVTAQLALGPEGLVVVAPAVTAPSGVALLARFCHADEGLRRAVEAHTAAEQACAGGRLLVDVAHLPGGQVGNVLLRPVLRSAELVYGGRSGAGAASEIAISDVYVTVAGDQIELYSRARRQRLSIRITNAHHFEGWWNLPVYRFLGALQRSEGRLSEAWSWGWLEASPFLPRITCEGVVLSRARWLLAPNELQRIAEPAPHAAFAAVQALRRELSLPRWVALWSEGTPLPVDLDNPLGVEVLSQAARGATELVLNEVFPSPEELAMKGPEGRFASEVIIPFIARAAAPAARSWPLEGDPEAVPHASRRFPPGSDWLYAKVYVGASQLDPVVQLLARQVVPELVAGGALRWFFVPYADPELHIRLRLLCPSPGARQAGLARLASVLSEHMAIGVVSRLQLDTYEREVERYGGLEGVELAEEVFWHDSQACIELLALSADEPELRWQLALAGIDRLYADFGLTFEGRSTLVSAALEALRESFGVTTATLESIGRKYRRYASRLGELLAPGKPAPPGEERHPVMDRARLVWAEREAGIAGVRPRLEEAARQRAITVGLPSLLASFAHMHAVRMLGPSARAHELVIYDFLKRKYATRRALAELGGDRAHLRER